MRIRAKEVSEQERKRIREKRMEEQSRKGYGGSICVDALLTTH